MKTINLHKIFFMILLLWIAYQATGVYGEPEIKVPVKGIRCYPPFYISGEGFEPETSYDISSYEITWGTVTTDQDGSFNLTDLTVEYNFYVNFEDQTNAPIKIEDHDSGDRVLYELVPFRDPKISIDPEVIRVGWAFGLYGKLFYPGTSYVFKIGVGDQWLELGTAIADSDGRILIEDIAIPLTSDLLNGPNSLVVEAYRTNPYRYSFSTSFAYQGPEYHVTPEKIGVEDTFSVSGYHFAPSTSFSFYAFKDDFEVLLGSVESNEHGEFNYVDIPLDDSFRNILNDDVINIRAEFDVSEFMFEIEHKKPEGISQPEAIRLDTTFSLNVVHLYPTTLFTATLLTESGYPDHVLGEGYTDETGVLSLTNLQLPSSYKLVFDEVNNITIIICDVSTGENYDVEIRYDPPTFDVEGPASVNVPFTVTGEHLLPNQDYTIEVKQEDDYLLIATTTTDTYGAFSATCIIPTLEDLFIKNNGDIEINITQVGEFPEIYTIYTYFNTPAIELSTDKVQLGYPFDIIGEYLLPNHLYQVEISTESGYESIIFGPVESDEYGEISFIDCRLMTLYKVTIPLVIRLRDINTNQILIRINADVYKPELVVPYGYLGVPLTITGTYLTPNTEYELQYSRYKSSTESSVYVGTVTSDNQGCFSYTTIFDSAYRMYRQNDPYTYYLFIEEQTDTPYTIGTPSELKKPSLTVDPNTLQVLLDFDLYGEYYAPDTIYDIYVERNDEPHLNLSRIETDENGVFTYSTYIYSGYNLRIYSGDITLLLQDPNDQYNIKYKTTVDYTKTHQTLPIIQVEPYTYGTNPIKVIVTYCNLGDYKEDLTAKFYVDGEVREAVSIPDLPKGYSVSYNYDLFLNEGIQNITAYVKPVPEETNVLDNRYEYRLSTTYLIRPQTDTYCNYTIRRLDESQAEHWAWEMVEYLDYKSEIEMNVRRTYHTKESESILTPVLNLLNRELDLYSIYYHWPFQVEQLEIGDEIPISWYDAYVISDVIDESTAKNHEAWSLIAFSEDTVMDISVEQDSGVLLHILEYSPELELVYNMTLVDDNIIPDTKKVVIDEFYSTPTRVDVGDPGEISLHLVWLSDFSNLEEGTVVIDGAEYSIGEEGWVTYQVSGDEIGAYAPTIEHVESTEQVDKIRVEACPSLIWDQWLLQSSSFRVQLAADVELQFWFTSEYDGSPLTDGAVTINGIPAEHVGEGVWVISVQELENTEAIFNQIEIDGNSLGISKISENTQYPTVIWDSLEVYESGVSETECSYGDSVTVWYKARFVSDNAEMDDTFGALYINEEPAEWRNDRWEREFKPEQLGANTFSATKTENLLGHEFSHVDNAGQQTTECWLQPQMDIALDNNLQGEIEVGHQLICPPDLSLEDALIKYYYQSEEEWIQFDEQLVSWCQDNLVLWTPDTDGIKHVKLVYEGDEGQYVKPIEDTASAYFSTSVDELLFVSSNSNIQFIVHTTGQKKISINVEGETGTEGSILIRIGKELMPDIDDLVIRIDGVTTSFTYRNEGHSWVITLEYVHSSHLIELVFLEPSPPPPTSGSSGGFSFPLPPTTMDVKVDEAYQSGYRVDVGCNVTIGYHLSFEDGTNATKCTVKIYGVEAITDTSGWALLNFSSHQVGEVVHAVENVEGSKVEDYEVAVENITVIWDMVNITLHSPRERIGVGDTPAISYDAWYVFDETLFNGTLAYNDTFNKTEVGEYNFTINDIDDHSYGLHCFTSNTLRLIYDMVHVDLANPDTRIDVSEATNITMHGYYLYDHQEFEGEILLNTSATNDEVGKKIFTVSEIHDSENDITCFSSNTVACIWDCLNITQLEANATEVPQGSPVTVWCKAEYLFDETEFNGSSGQVYLNNTEMAWSEDHNRWEYTKVMNKPGEHVIKVTGLTDDKYELNQLLNSEEITIIVLEKSWINLDIRSVAIVAALIGVASTFYTFRKK
ncbi:hypothetical protein JXL21_07515 [Candidatus Bathyarchaeota archaeon]|nr:hypothetical protein [Candidatus Bathyarchaeota archaeon]